MLFPARPKQSPVRHEEPALHRQIRFFPERGLGRTPARLRKESILGEVWDETKSVL